MSSQEYNTELFAAYMAKCAYERVLALNNVAITLERTARTCPSVAALALTNLERVRAIMARDVEELGDLHSQFFKLNELIDLFELVDAQVHPAIT